MREWEKLSILVRDSNEEIKENENWKSVSLENNDAEFRNKKRRDLE